MVSMRASRLLKRNTAATRSANYPKVKSLALLTTFFDVRNNPAKTLHFLDLITEPTSALVDLVPDISSRSLILIGVIKVVLLFERFERGPALIELHFMKIVIQAHPFAQSELNLVGEIDGRVAISLSNVIWVVLSGCGRREHQQ